MNLKLLTGAGDGDRVPFEFHYYKSRMSGLENVVVHSVGRESFSVRVLQIFLHVGKT